MPKYLTPETMSGGILASRQLPAGETTVYTVPENVTAVISHGTLCNVSAAPVSVSVSAVPAGGVADTTHRTVSNFSLAARDTLGLRDTLDGMMLGAGDFISVNAGAGGAVDVVIGGSVTSATGL